MAEVTPAEYKLSVVLRFDNADHLHIAQRDPECRMGLRLLSTNKNCGWHMHTVFGTSSNLIRLLRVIS